MSDPDADPRERPSRSARKRDAQDLQALGEALIELPPAELDALGLPDTLHGAIVAARGITSHGARVRQRQYIGKLMRNVDAAPIRAALEHRQHVDRARVRRERHIEQMRDRLVADDPAAWADLQKIRPESVAELDALAKQARAERGASRPPAAARRLFRRLREIVADPTPAAPPGAA